MNNKLFELVTFLSIFIMTGCTNNSGNNSEASTKNTQCDSVVSLRDFSEEALAASLAEDKVVFIIIRSDHSIWSKTLLDTKKAYKLQSEGKIDFLDLKWSWESDSREAETFFDKFGYDKEAFIVICKNGEFQKLPNAFLIDNYLSEHVQP